MPGVVEVIEDAQRAIELVSDGVGLAEVAVLFGWVPFTPVEELGEGASNDVVLVVEDEAPTHEGDGVPGPGVLDLGGVVEDGEREARVGLKTDVARSDVGLEVGEEIVWELSHGLFSKEVWDREGEAALPPRNKVPDLSWVRREYRSLSDVTPTTLQ
jgi:hypothetical protein